jgi:hypothetical protein
MTITAWIASFAYGTTARRGIVLVVVWSVAGVCSVRVLRT